MFWDEEFSETEKKQQSLDKELKELLSDLMRDYLVETEKHLPSIEKEIKSAKKFDPFGNEISPEGKDEEVWGYFAEKNLWENIFTKKYKTRQAHYLDRLESFLSETVENPERHIELFGRGLVWRYYAKMDDSGACTFAYLKTDDPLDPLSRTVKTFYKRLNFKKLSTGSASIESIISGIPEIPFKLP
ncbi:hypothetical protein IKF63_00435 [Candidatus Saccharibacteria bacterium]|nr:hypothetical protein [Candidatus Saccharibacteria bacterium]